VEALDALEGTFARHYFRLLHAHQRLARQSYPAPGFIEQLEAERTRIARELHSGAGQALAGIKLHLEILENLMRDLSGPVRHNLDRIGLLAQEALEQVRNISQRLHPPDWQRLNLAAALERLWTTTGMPERYQAVLDVRPLPEEPPAAVRAVLYRVAQEAIANVIRHSGATQVRMVLGIRNGSVLLEVSDNGKGFEPEKVAGAAGIGLRAIRDQVRHVGGRVSVTSGNEGTRVQAVVPL